VPHHMLSARTKLALLGLCAALAAPGIAWAQDEDAKTPPPADTRPAPPRPPAGNEGVGVREETGKKVKTESEKSEAEREKDKPKSPDADTAAPPARPAAAPVPKPARP